MMPPSRDAAHDAPQQGCSARREGRTALLTHQLHVLLGGAGVLLDLVVAERLVVGAPHTEVVDDLGTRDSGSA